MQRDVADGRARNGDEARVFHGHAVDGAARNDRADALVRVSLDVRPAVAAADTDDGQAVEGAAVDVEMRGIRDRIVRVVADYPARDGHVFDLAALHSHRRAAFDHRAADESLGVVQIDIEVPARVDGRARNVTGVDVDDAAREGLDVVHAAAEGDARHHGLVFSVDLDVSPGGDLVQCGVGVERHVGERVGEEGQRGALLSPRETAVLDDVGRPRHGRAARAAVKVEIAVRVDGHGVGAAGGEQYQLRAGVEGGAGGDGARVDAHPPGVELDGVGEDAARDDRQTARGNGGAQRQSAVGKDQVAAAVEGGAGDARNVRVDRSEAQGAERHHRRPKRGAARRDHHGGAAVVTAHERIGHRAARADVGAALGADGHADRLSAGAAGEIEQTAGIDHGVAHRAAADLQIGGMRRAARDQSAPHHIEVGAGVEFEIGGGAAAADDKAGHVFRVAAAYEPAAGNFDQRHHLIRGGLLDGVAVGVQIGDHRAARYPDQPARVHGDVVGEDVVAQNDRRRGVGAQPRAARHRGAGNDHVPDVDPLVRRAGDGGVAGEEIDVFVDAAGLDGDRCAADDVHVIGGDVAQDGIRLAAGNDRAVEEGHVRLDGIGADRGVTARVDLEIGDAAAPEIHGAAAFDGAVVQNHVGAVGAEYPDPRVHRFIFRRRDEVSRQIAAEHLYRIGTENLRTARPNVPVTHFPNSPFFPAGAGGTLVFYYRNAKKTVVSRKKGIPPLYP